jgi:hypothetical protein
MNTMARAIRETLKASQGESRVGELSVLGQRLRDTFNKRLGGIDVFGTEKEQSGGLLRIVADRGGIAVAFHMGGTLTYRGVESDRIHYEIIRGSGRAFKFMKHPEYEPVEKSEFFGAGFPYAPRELTFSKVTGGTVARVRCDVQRAFCADAVCRVTAYGIEDVRLFHCGGELFDAVQTVFEDTVSNVGGEWERILRLLSS